MQHLSDVSILNRRSRKNTSCGANEPNHPIMKPPNVQMLAKPEAITVVAMSSRATASSASNLSLQANKEHDMGRQTPLGTSANMQESTMKKIHNVMFFRRRINAMICGVHESILYLCRC